MVIDRLQREREREREREMEMRWQWVEGDKRKRKKIGGKRIGGLKNERFSAVYKSVRTGS